MNASPPDAAEPPDAIPDAPPGAAERERLLAAAEAQRVRAEGVLHGMADAYVALDAAFRVTDVNPAMVRAVRLGRDAMLGRSFWELFPGTVGTAFEEHYRRVAGGGRDAHFTHDYSDGRLDLVSEVDVYPAPGGGIAVFWRDVTARVRAEAALRRREAKYRALFATMDQGFCIVQLVFDAAGRPVDYLFVEANPAFARQTGLADAVGRSARELVPGLEQHWVDLYARVARSGEPARFEQGSEAMGRWFDVHAFPVSDAADHRVAVLFTDVSGARQAARERERLLAESEAARRALEAARLRADRLQQLTEALAVPLTREQAVRAMIEQALSAVGAVAGGVLAVADDGRALELLDVVGYEEEVAERYQRLPADAPLPMRDVVRRGLPIFLPSAAAFAAAGYAPRNRLASGALGEAWATLPLVIDQRVAGVLTLTFAAPREFPPEEQAFALAFARQCAQALERSALYEAERASRAEAEAARAAAEAANRGKSEFLAVMSHELRTPLNAIGGYAELIEMGIRGPVTAEQRADLERIQRAQRHLLGLINGVLNYARVEAGAVHYALAEVPLDEVLATCEALVAPQVRAKRLTLRHDAAARDVRVRADADKVQQVVLNLLSNAVKFTEPGGRLTLSTALADGRVLVRVADTGIGIAAGEMARVFEPFVQVDASLTRTREGTGLGLAISRDLARGMGGDLTAESVAGVGSVFTLVLPAA
jgi:PAS domain S-box-containing protein